MSLRSLRVLVASLSSGLPVLPLVIVLAAVAASPPRASAQVLYGSIVGNVHDSSGAILPGATVTILHEETKLTREAIADSAGGYTVPEVLASRFIDRTRNAMVVMRAGAQTVPMT